MSSNNLVKKKKKKTELERIQFQASHFYYNYLYE